MVAVAGRAGVRLGDAPWKREVLADWSAIGEDGQFVHRRCGLSGPRQMGKSWDGIGWVTVLAMMGFKVLWSDHNYATTCEMLRRFKDIFGSRPVDRMAKHPEFNRLVVQSNNKTAQEAIFLRGGGMIGFSTRTDTSSLGYEYDVLVLDEAQELTDEHLQAMLPTNSGGSMGNPQTIYIGSPERLGHHGDRFGRFRADCLAGAAGPACWTEFGLDRMLTAEEMADDAMFLDLLSKANPSVGHTANVDAIMAGARSMTLQAASQEYFGWWPARESANAAIDAGKWDACLVPDDGAPSGDAGWRMALGIRFSADGQTVAVSWAARPADGEGRCHVELYDMLPTWNGTDALAAWVAERAGRFAEIGIDGKSGAQAFAQRLASLGVPRRAIRVYTASDAQAAAATLVDKVNAGEVTHIASPALDESARRSVRRRIGADGFGFGDAAGCTAAPVESAAIALRSVLTSRRRPGRKARVW